MKIRYIGPEPEVLLPIAGAALVCVRRKWLDPEQAALDVFVPVEHVQIVVAGLDPALWEIDDKNDPKPDPAPAADDQEQDA